MKIKHSEYDEKDLQIRKTKLLDAFLDAVNFRKQREIRFLSYFKLFYFVREIISSD